MSERTISDAEQLIRRLYSITTAYGDGFPAQLRSLLALGCERFSLDVGIVARVEGGIYHVVESSGRDPRPGPGDEFPLGNTYCEITLRASSPVGFHHFESHQEAATHPCYSAFGLEAYLGTPIHNRQGVFGTLNFSSVSRRAKEFTDVDIDAIQLMATWIGGELERQALEERVNTIHGMIPICSSCKKIRSGHGDWQPLESYLGAQAHLEFTHGVCPSCRDEMMT